LSGLDEFPVKYDKVSVNIDIFNWSIIYFSLCKVSCEFKRARLLT